MKLKSTPSRQPVPATLGYAMIEVIMGVALTGFMFVSLYGGISSSFAVTQLARENLRGTQIMLERMEGIRLYNWDQLCYSNMIPAIFTNYYYPLATNGQSKGIVYSGNMIVTNSSLSPWASYGDKMRTITVSISWTNSNIPRSRSISTLVSKNGVQNYVYNN